MAYSDNELFFQARNAIRAGRKPFEELEAETVKVECSII